MELDRLPGVGVKKRVRAARLWKGSTGSIASHCTTFNTSLIKLGRCPLLILTSDPQTAPACNATLAGLVPPKRQATLLPHLSEVFGMKGGKLLKMGWK